MSASFRSFLVAGIVALLATAARAQDGLSPALAPTAPPAAPAASTATPATGAPAPAAAAKMTSPTDAAQKMIADAVAKMNLATPDIDGAINDLSRAVQASPNSTGAYVLRASLYIQKKQYPQAEADFQAAAKLAPTNKVLKYNMLELKFMEKQYDVARVGFVTLQKDSDSDMADFAAYKVFLCDLFAGHEDVAKKELDVFNAAMGNPSYYFSNAAWSLVHKNLEDARGWLVSASRIYPPRKNQFYAQSLRDLGYLPIPAPGDQVTPAPATTPAPSGQ
jgi:tetratricopeptide (TPR) repeat protein